MYQYPMLGAKSAASVLSSPTRLLPRPVEWTWPNKTRDSLAILDQASSFESPWKRTTAQAAGVLIVDDDPHILAAVSAILLFEGYVVWKARNGREALAVLDRATPALVMLDLRMPGLDGWGFAQALHQRSLEVPVLVMTASLDGQLSADEIGAAGCLTKPFDMQDLLEQVSRFVPPD